MEWVRENRANAAPTTSRGHVQEVIGVFPPMTRDLFGSWGQAMGRKRVIGAVLLLVAAGNGRLAVVHSFTEGSRW